MTVRTIDEIFRDFVTDGVPASGPFNPHKPDIRDTLKALTEGGDNFPDNRVIRLNNADEGTANNIVVTASVAIPAAAYQVLYILNVTQENTGPVMVSGAINRALVTNISQPIAPGYLVPGMALLCIDTGTELRLLSYGADEAILAAAEAAADRAEDAAAAAEAAVGGQLSNFDSRASVAAATILPLVSYVRTAGYYAAGDGGAALYKRASSEPSHAGKVQSADGAWWELADQELNVKMFGAKGDGATDDWQSITNAIEYCRQTYTPPSARPYYPQRWTMRFHDGAMGKYAITKPLVHVAGCTIVMDKGASLKAIAAMSAMVTTENVNYLSNHHFGRFEGGQLDANSLAQRCMHPKYFGHYTIEDTQMFDPTLHHIELGVSDAVGGVYEAMLKGLLLRRSVGMARPTGSCGVLITKCGDSHFEDIIIMSVESGIKGPLWDSKITRVHVWNYPELGGLSTAFHISGGQNIFSQCQVDGPLVSGGSGWYFTQPGNVLLGCSVNGEIAGSNLAQGVYLDTGAVATIVGCTFKTASGTLSGDIMGPGVDGSTFLGNQSVSCTVVQGTRSPMVGTKSYTVATLPTNRQRGDRAFVTDASVITFGSNVAGGGASWMPVVFNGNNWIVG